MSQTKKVSSVYIRLVTPGTFCTPKTYSSLEASQAGYKPGSSTSNEKVYANGHGGRATVIRVPSTPKAFNTAHGGLTSPPLPPPPSPPPPPPVNEWNSLQPEEFPLPPPPSPDHREPPALDYTHTRLQDLSLGTSSAKQPRSAASKPEGYRATTAEQTPGNSPSLKPDAGLNGLPEICGYCRGVIPLTMPAVQAMDQLFHEDCLKCRICQCRLVGKIYFNLKGSPYCDPCYQDTLEKCGKCGKRLVSEIMRALGKAFHPDCFTCVVCHKPIGNARFGLNQANEIHCIQDFQRRYAPQCSVCNQPIMSETGTGECMNIELFDRHFHIDCYKCEECGILLSPDPTDEGCFPLRDRILCKTCSYHCSRAEVPNSIKI